MNTLQGKHKMRCILVELLILAQVTRAKYFCEESWLANQENGRCYKFFPGPLPWKEARETCTKEGGFLLSLRDDNELRFIDNNFLHDMYSIWSGGHSLYDEGWVWDNYNVPFNLTNWNKVSPEQTFHCLSLSGLSSYAENCTLHREFICEKSAKILYCDGTPNVVRLQPNELTTVSFPPFYDPLKPFHLPPYEKNLNCVWSIVPPSGYKIVMEYYPFCNDNLKVFQGNTLLENVTCREHFGNSVAEKPIVVSFKSDSFTKPRSEQGFQFRLFATDVKGSPCDERGLPLMASPEKKVIASPGFPLQRPISCFWTIFSPVKDAIIYVQLKYLFFSEQTFLQIQNNVFAKSVILEESELIIYPEEKISLNYTSNDSYAGHHGFVLEYYTDKPSVSICTQKHTRREISQYGVPNPQERYTVFSVKVSTSDVKVELVTENKDSFYMTFDQDGRRACLRKRGHVTSCLEEFSGRLLKKDLFQDFWMSWFDTLKVGRGRIPGNDIILDFRIYNPMNVTSVIIQTVNGTGEWKFYGPAFKNDFVESCHISGSPEKPLWELQLPPRNQHYLIFSVRLCASGLLTFQATNGSSYRIWLDAAAKNKSGVLLSCFTAYESTNGIYTCISTISYDLVLNCTSFQLFWISWENGKKIEIGKGKMLGRNVIASLRLGYIPISTSFKFGSPAHDSQYSGSIWRFFGTLSNSEILNITNSQVVPSVREVEGSTLTMSVEINIRFGFEVKWYRNGTRVIHSPGRFLIQQTFIDTMTCSLKILELKLRDEANWTVVLSNQLSSVAKSFDIKVSPGLRLYLFPRYRFAIQKGSSLLLVCNITNLETLVGISVDVSLLTWYKDGSPLQHDGRRVFITNKSSYSQLRVSAIAQDDEGTYSCNHDKYRVSMVINATVDVYDKGEVVCPSTTDVYGIQWPVNIRDTITHADCPNGKQGNASRFCDNFGTWQKTRVSYCADAQLSNALNELQILDNDGVSDTNLIEQTFETSLTKTANLTSSEETVSSANILSSINIINTVLKVANQSNASVPDQNVFNIVDHMTSAKNKDSWKLVEEETYSGPASVLETMEKTSSILMKGATLKEFRGDNIVVNISKVSLQEADLQFLDNDSFIVLPKQYGNQKQATKYSAVLYKTMSQFLPSTSNTSRSRSDSVINSVVMSLTFEQPLHELSPPLELTFQHNEGVKVADEEADCVFWDYTLFDGSGGWSSEGCFTNSSADGATVCLCNHTTNFAILMRPYTPEKEDSALVIISIVGCVISMLFTALTVGVYIYLWKKIKSDQNILIICLCISLFVAYLVLLTGVDNAQDEVLCIVITALLHFFLLLTFFMMLGVGTYFFMNVTVLFYAMHITNNFNARSRLKWIAGSATCLPLIIVFITLGSCWNTQYHSEAFCWLSVTSGAIYAFIVPVLLIFLLNLGIIVSLLRVMFLTTKMKKADMKDKVRNALKSVCTLIPVLGVTWVFGIFAINEDLVVFQYIFTIANSIQGLLIFITHVLLNNKVKKSLRSKHPSLKRKRDKDVDHAISSSTDHLTSNTHTTALVPVNQTVYKDPDKVSESDIHIETEATSSETQKTNYVMERVKFLSSMETQIVGGKIVSQTGASTQILTDSKEGTFESKFSTEGVKNCRQEVKWGGGGMMNNIKPEGNRCGEIRITKEVRVQHTNIEKSRVVTSNTSQISTVNNTALHEKVTFSQISNNETEFEA